MCMLKRRPQFVMLIEIYRIYDFWNFSYVLTMSWNLTRWGLGRSSWVLRVFPKVALNGPKSSFSWRCKKVLKNASNRRLFAYPRKRQKASPGQIPVQLNMIFPFEINCSDLYLYQYNSGRRFQIWHPFHRIAFVEWAMADLSVFLHIKSDISYINLTCFSIHRP